MADSFTKLPFGTSRFQRYHSNASDALPSDLSQPSQNCLITSDGKVESRFGYQEEFSIGVDGSPATCYYNKTYDLAFFALGTKVYYRDFTNEMTVDTGITLTTGTVTRFTEWFGMIFLTNTTDGLKMIVLGRLNDSAATVGDSTVGIDIDMAGRLSAFSLTADNLRVNGTTEDMASIDVSTGIVSLNVNLTQSYNDNAVCIVVKDITSEKFSKVEFWKNRLHGMGFPSATNADQPNNTVMAGEFVIGQTGADGIEKIIDFTYGTQGSTKITVGTGGKLTNILGEEDNLWFFNEDRSFAAEAAEVNAETPSASTPGSALGLTIPRLKDKNHGCLNEDSAIAMGNGDIGYITNDRRIMRRSIATNQGAAVPFSDENFDVDIRDHLKNMDRDQTGALAYFYNGQRKAIFQVKISGQWYWFIFDYNLTRQIGSTAVAGAWQPPQNISPVTGFFERNGVLYGTDVSDDTVYSFFTTFTDNLSPILCTIATGEFNVGDAMMGLAKLEGDLNQPSMINILCYVWNNTSGKRPGSPKIIDGSKYSYSADLSVGAVPVGDGGVTGETTQVARWKKQFSIFPSETYQVQLVLTNEVDGGYLSLTAFSLTGNQYPDTFSSSL